MSTPFFLSNLILATKRRRLSHGNPSKPETTSLTVVARGRDDYVSLFVGCHARPSRCNTFASYTFITKTQVQKKKTKDSANRSLLIFSTPNKSLQRCEHGFFPAPAKIFPIVQLHINVRRKARAKRSLLKWRQIEMALMRMTSRDTSKSTEKPPVRTNCVLLSKDERINDDLLLMVSGFVEKFIEESPKLEAYVGHSLAHCPGSTKKVSLLILVRNNCGSHF